MIVKVDIFFESLLQILKYNKLKLYLGNFIPLYNNELSKNYYRRCSDNHYNINNDISLYFNENKLKENKFDIYQTINSITIVTISAQVEYIDNLMYFIDKIVINNSHNFNHNTYVNYNSIKEICDKNNIKIECKDPITEYNINNQLITDTTENHYALLIAAFYLSALIYDYSLFEYKFIMNGFHEKLIKDVNYYIDIFINNLKNEIKTHDNSWRIEYNDKFNNLLKIYMTRKSFNDGLIFECEHLYSFFYNLYKNNILYKNDGFFNVLMHKLKQHIKLNDIEN